MALWLDPVSGDVSESAAACSAQARSALSEFVERLRQSRIVAEGRDVRMAFGRVEAGVLELAIRFILEAR